MSFYDDASLVFLAGGAAGKDGKVYNLKPVEELSSTEVVINGGFSIDGPGTDGELGTSYGDYGWNTVSPSPGVQEGTTTISNGVLKLTNALGETDSRAYATDGISSRNVITTNTYYKLVYTIVENNGCTSFKVYNAGGVQEDAPSSVGTHTVTLRNTSNQLFLFFNKTESSSISIDNVSIREITNQAADFTFTRGTNLTATRVGKDGYIEKGRTIYTLNTVWAGAGTLVKPTGWSDTKSTDGDGSYAPVPGSNGQIKFEVTDATDSSNDERFFLQSAGAAVTPAGIYATSVYVDEVTGTAPAVRDVVLSVVGGSDTKTNIGFFKNDTESIDATTAVEAGNRYTSVAYLSGSGYHRFGLGTNADINSNCSVTLSRPQIETGLVSTTYRENTSTTDVVKIGLLEDEPRFDYTGGGCPALLIEGNAINLIEHTEYFGAWTEDGTATVTLNQTTSPEGLTNAALLDYGASPAGPDRISTTATITGSTVYAFSVFAKEKDASKIQLRNYHGPGADASAVFDLAAETVTVGPNVDRGTIEDYGNGWYRCTMIFTSDPADILADLRIGAPNTYSDPGEEIYIYGAQLEENDYATSYIPNYGTAATASRSYDDPNDVVHGITMGTSCSFFLEATNFKVTETAGPQTSFLQIMDATSPSTNDRFLFLGIGNVGSTFTLQAQNKESGTSTTTNLSKTELPMGSPFKALARYDGTSFDLFVNGVLEDSDTIVADDHFGRVGLKNLTSQNQNGHSINQVLLFDSALSNNDSEILTGATSYNSFADMATSTALNYTLYE